MSQPMHNQAQMLSHLKERSQSIHAELTAAIETLSVPEVYGTSPGRPPKDDPMLAAVHQHLVNAEQQLRQAMQALGTVPEMPRPR